LIAAKPFFMEIPEHFIPNPKLRLREQLGEGARFLRLAPSPLRLRPALVGLFGGFMRF
jgi:hypothetical protein